MKILDVVFGLHLYQPPTQRLEVLEKITRECYQPLPEVLGQTPCHFMVDIAGALILQLNRQNPAVLAAFRKLVEEKKISLANTAAYHPILPLVPREFTGRQLALNEDFYRAYRLLPFRAKCSGVFPPEMAVSPKLFQTLHDLGYCWTVTDDVSFTALLGQAAPVDWIPVAEGIPCFLRSNLWSGRIGFEMPEGAAFANQLWTEFSQRFPDRDRVYVVLWMDGETFGHHHPQAFERFLIPFLRTCRNLPIHLTNPDTLLTLYPQKSAAVPAGSWSTSPDQARAQIPYPLWHHPGNPWHGKWWELAGLVLEIAEVHPEVRWLCDRALYSCQTWWVGLYGDKIFFRWTIPDFEEILNIGTAAEQERGKELIRQLQQ